MPKWNLAVASCLPNELSGKETATFLWHTLSIQHTTTQGVTNQPTAVCGSAHLLTGRSELVKSWKPLMSTPAGPTQHCCLSSLTRRVSLHQPATVHLLKWESLPVLANTCLGSLHDDNQTPALSGNNKSCHLQSFKQEIQNFDWHSSKFYDHFEQFLENENLLNSM